MGYTSAIGTSKGGHTILEFSFAIQEMKPNITSPFTSQIRAWFVYCTYLSCQMPSFFILKLEYLFLRLKNHIDMVITIALVSIS